MMQPSGLLEFGISAQALTAPLRVASSSASTDMPVRG
jgi:hypothetical protein